MGSGRPCVGVRAGRDRGDAEVGPAWLECFGEPLGSQVQKWAPRNHAQQLSLGESYDNSCLLQELNYGDECLGGNPAHSGVPLQKLVCVQLKMPHYIQLSRF